MRETIKAEEHPIGLGTLTLASVTFRRSDVIPSASTVALLKAMRKVAVTAALAMQEQWPVNKSVVPAIVTKQRIYTEDPAQAAVLVKYLLEFARLQVFALAAGTNSVIAFPNGGPAVSKKLPDNLKVLSHDAHAIRTLDQFVFQHFGNHGRGVLVVGPAPTREMTSQIPVLHVLDLPDPIAAMRKADFEQGKNGVYLVPFAVPSLFALGKFTTSAAHAPQLVKGKWYYQPQSLQEINAVKAELHQVYDQLGAAAANMPKVPVPPTVASVLVQIPKAAGFAGHAYSEWLPDLLKSTTQLLKVTVATAHLIAAQPRVLRVTDNVTTLKLELRGDKRVLNTVVTTLDKLRYSFNTKLLRITAEYYVKPVWVVTAVANNGGEPAGPAVAAI
ncbi:hypothetical protein AMAG_16745 [Allomyces macrogynus ATCC 38327]|uniref:Uncharacterized protein n=1 Tax=Allomyces macrogynus (strain ATCC 38327) TaxID=578462 RepID=A0A0L0TBS0_ALLM3|nr:hypothetical protein AMAG_16745 [Allomyces macrogynus ATCC 38327]|eukprot:KNE72258.1 hypothetical protein AMAG_16745 [Allomyces macrogynus ATCC 38327]